MTDNSRTMAAAVLHGYGVPRYDRFATPEDNRSDAVLIRPLAAAVNGVDRAIASGKHFLSPEKLPAVAGRDGVGLTTDDRLVYFDGPLAPYGSMAEQTLVERANVIEIPRDTDPAIAAALGNAGLAAWLPLSWRAKVKKGETVVILGAGGYVGSLAVQVACELGAGRIIGVVQGEPQAARARKLGAETTIDTSTRPDVAACLKTVAPAGVDVVVDYLWGDVAASTLDGMATGGRVVQVGTVAGDRMSLSGETLRSRGLDIMGFASFHAPAEERAEAYRRLVALASQNRIRPAVRRFPLSQVEAAWSTRDNGPPTRAVLMTDA